MVDIKLQLPEHFLEEEVREGYTVSAEMKEIWAVELDLLQEFMRVCDAHGIKYYGDAGTILGAVRHKGYIPWDDDIDVMMLREDYQKLCEIGPREFRHPYFFQTQYTDPGMLAGHAQLRNSLTTGILANHEKWHFSFNQGIFLDIFPIDNVPDDDQLLIEQCEKATAFMKKAQERSVMKDRYYPESTNPVKKTVKALAHWVISGPLKGIDYYEQYFKAYEQTIMQYDATETRRVAKYFTGMPTEKDRHRRVWDRSFFDTTVYLPFEMLTIPVPGKYLELLDLFYGDWKVPVRGTATHGGVIFDTSRSYKEYVEDVRSGKKKV